MRKCAKLKSQNVDRVNQAINQTRTDRPVRQDLGILRDSRASFSALLSFFSLGFL